MWRKGGGNLNLNLNLNLVALVFIIFVLVVGPAEAWFGGGKGKGKGKGPAVCVSKANWAKYERHGKVPRHQKDLTYCSRWREDTCCDAEQTNRARTLYSTMDYRTTSKGCREVWQLLQCSVCSPHVGVVNATGGRESKGGKSIEEEDFHHRVPLTREFCDRVYSECETSQFAGDEDYAIRGCSPDKDVVCSKLKHWNVSPREFCEMAGFRVCGYGGDEDDLFATEDDEGYCYDGEEHTEEGLKREKQKERQWQKKQRSYKSSRRRLGIKGRGFFRRVFGKEREKQAREAALVGALVAGSAAAFYLYRRRKREARKGYYYDAGRTKVIRKLQKDLNEANAAKRK
ncbi:folate receptor domain-containing protein [Chloropicon primus]|uniref:Folate receptor-like domain-containing protein n=1 Tax=Chloropicon primus TaxID=1764295 RepID=A0A5B8MJJ5_9CHLO|nr:hypothetical protein A3770_04p27720 [Chloropicon primus]UPQ99463.1 folate receptor domain-containing protein [Chloropicon primus]|eukprot:QDZ20254.1 hypothetical protein A3770_04p27720 [Chloropicon primus]